MTLTFFSNRLNHHQVPVADELYKILGNSYTFVETMNPLKSSNKGCSENFSARPYLLQAWKSEELKERALSLTVQSDIAIFGARSLEYEVERSKKTDKISFDMSERWLKRGFVNLFSPRLLKHQWYYHTLFYKKPVYKLCSSAYAAKDQYKMHSFRNKCFKWGYFPRLENFEIETLSPGDSISIIWCARFLKLKHPELAVCLASRLKDEGYRFTIDMYGEGPEQQATKDLARKLGVEDVVKFHGFLPNEDILAEMRRHQIFLFTSDRNEGWGVVANEAMTSGCALVADSSIGSTPYLVKHRRTGCVYRNGSLDDLFYEVKWLFDNENELRRIRINGREHIRRFWNPRHAAQSLVALSENLMQGKKNSIVEGPCSNA